MAENATIAPTYDKRIREHASELSKFRERDKGIIKLPAEEDNRIKRYVIRECGITVTFSTKNNGKGDKGPENKKGAERNPKNDKPGDPWTHPKGKGERKHGKG